LTIQFLNDEKFAVTPEVDQIFWKLKKWRLPLRIIEDFTNILSHSSS